MALPITELKHESVQGREEIASYLESIAQGVRAGQVAFRHGEQDIALKPAEQVSLQVEVKQTEAKSRIKFKVSWESQSSQTNDPLVIE